MEKKHYIICGKFFDGAEQILKKDVKIIVEGTVYKSAHNSGSQNNYLGDDENYDLFRA